MVVWVLLVPSVCFMVGDSPGVPLSRWPQVGQVLTWLAGSPPGHCFKCPCSVKELHAFRLAGFNLKVVSRTAPVFPSASFGFFVLLSLVPTLTAIPGIMLRNKLLRPRRWESSILPAGTRMHQGEYWMGSFWLLLI